MWEIAGYLGHADSRTTERIYAHHSPDYLERARQAFD
jgi:integrase